MAHHMLRQYADDVAGLIVFNFLSVVVVDVGESFASFMDLSSLSQ
jgi:hypothetical protein